MIDKHEKRARDHLRLVHSADPVSSEWDDIMAAEVPDSPPLDHINNRLKIAFSMSEFDSETNMATLRFEIFQDEHFIEAAITWYDQSLQVGLSAVLAQITFKLRSEDIHPDSRYILRQPRSGLVLEIADMDDKGQVYARECTEEEAITVAKLIDKIDILHPID